MTDDDDLRRIERISRTVWIEAERIRREARDRHHDSAAVCAARLRIVNREVEQSRGQKAHRG
jgi:hypothetical protein